MKEKTLTMILVGMSILLFVVIISFGFIYSINKSKLINEYYHTDITLSEGVIFDDPHLINEYGAPITLNKGFQGVIDYYIDWREKEHNYERIRAKFILENNDEVVVYLMPKQEAESNGYYIVQSLDASIEKYDGSVVQTIPGTIDVVIPIIGFNKIEEAQTIMSEYKQIVETYNQKVKQTIISGSIVAIVIAIILVFAIWLLYYFVRNGKVRKAIVVISICIDVVMVIASIFELYVSQWL